MPPKKASKKDAVADSAAEAAPSSPTKPVTADTPQSPSKSPEKPAKKKPAAKKAPSTEKPVKEKKEAKPKAPKAAKEEKPKAAAKKTAAAAPKKKPAKKEEEPSSSSGAENSTPAKKKSASSGGESSPKKSGPEGSPKKSAAEASPKKKPAAKKRTKSEAENGTAAGSSSPAKKAKKAAVPKKTDKAEKAAAKPKTKKTPTKAETGGESSAAEGAGTPAKKKRPAKKKAEADTENGGNASSPAPKKTKKKAATSKEGEAGAANKSEGEATPAKEKKPAKPRARKPKPVEDDAPVVGQRKNFQPLPTAMPKLLKKTIAPKNRTKPPTSGEEEEAASGAEEEPVEKKPSKADAGGKKRLNATDTDWENQNFQINSGFKLKVASWNVSGLRAWLEKGGRNYIMHERPDIVCLQETKCKPDVIPPEATISGYHPYWLGFSGHAGVGIYSRQMPLNVTYGIGDKEMDEEGRMLTAEYEKFFLVNAYVPNAGRKLVTLPKRLRWNKLFKEYIQALDRQKAVIICGDMNVAHEEIDLANPKTNKKNAGFTQEERDGMTDFLESCQFVDTFRHFYPKEKDAYTFWTYMSNARAKNVGWRLDYILVSQRIVSKVVDNKIRSRVFGSDHCPIVGFFNL